MKIYFKLMVIPFLLIFLFGGTALSASFGTNITISDENYNNNTAWYSDREDNEVEPGMAMNQGWDLEGFFLSDDFFPTLTMVGGYDFVNGNGNYRSGDIFLDINGDAEYGKLSGSDGNDLVQDTFGYDYVLDMNFDILTYDVYTLSDSSMTTTAYYAQNEGSNPWQYDPSENNDVKISSGTIGYQSFSGDLFLEDINQTLYGDIHYAASVNLGFLTLAGYDNFISHFTMQCGNDNLMGSTAPVPEPATLLLFGTGLIGLAGIGRKKFKK